MKNFRKTIIALATVAAMLVPSVAMAATLTTTVDKDITGDVYVGFYDGAILKDVVKTTVDDITVDDATPAGTEETLPATVTITDVATGLEAADAPGEEVRKLVFTATAADRKMTGFDLVMSYDTEAVTLISTTDEYYGDIPADELAYYETEFSMWPYTMCKFDKVTVRPNGSQSVKTITFSKSTSLHANIGTRAAVHYVQYIQDEEAPLDNLVLTEIYYRVNEGKEVTADTFKIETEIGEGTFNAATAQSGAGFASSGAEVGIKIASKQGSMTYGAWNNGTAVADTIKLVTPWDVQESTTKDLTVTVPAGAEGYTPTMFIWDADQIAQCAPITTFTKN